MCGHRRSLKLSISGLALGQFSTLELGVDCTTEFALGDEREIAVHARINPDGHVDSSEAKGSS